MPDGDITTFGSSASAAYQVPADINNAGIIVGSYADLSTDTSHGFVRLGGTIYSFDAPGARSTSLTGINNWNEIVGISSDLHGNDKLFKVDFTPVPEPSALYLLVFGSTGLGLLTRLRIKHQ
jgi:hypothetical protein